MDYNLDVHWRGERVGELRDAVPDMWYLEGAWVASSSEAAQQFETLVRSFDTRAVFSDHTKGTRVVLFGGESTLGVGTHAVVISLSDGRLFVRRYIDQAAIEWLTKNVP